MNRTSSEIASSGTEQRNGPCRIAIFGGRGGAVIVAGYVGGTDEASGEVIGLLNDASAAGERINGYRVLGSFAAWRELPGDTRFLAPLHKAKEMPDRARLIRELAIPDARWATLIDPRAAVAADAMLGPGCHVGPFAEIHPGARFGRHVGIRGSAKISHDCTIGDFVFVGLNAVVCGYAALGEGAHISPQATIRESTRVGRFAVVGLGAVVVEDVADFAIVAGNPARRIGTVPAAGNSEV